ncbi:SsrA-binding protein [Candidatus Saccharibacteria bacterium RIFCSPHIGHO2_12_FULL_47_16b]|nr:MAG: SsrA-binding protein [Candidatus Saccharibacteria bacterium RIFCSPHIGHO2_12_FULL_47_16b]OGL39901.1 MAG: SsrA-binding protein [Candidatus Saccharibacteria bacterium RIFCSPLOWO2_02_FULL_46_7]
MRKKKLSVGRIVNRRARFDYELGDEFVVGLQLSGVETKALRLKHGQLAGAYVADKDGELWLIGAQIMGSPTLPISEQDQIRSRKLLAKRSEIDKIIAARRAGQSAIPLEILTTGRYIKLRLAIGKGKKRYDKRETIKRRQQERDIARKVRS